MAAPAKRKRRLWDAYAFPGFRPEETVRGIFGDAKARILRLRRRSKKRIAVVVDAGITAGTIARCAACAIFPASNSKCDAFVADIAAK